MPTNILIQIPDSLRLHHTHLLKFFEGMIRKLDLNSHKDTPSVKSIPQILDDLQQEVIEFEEQMALNKFDENTLVELMDTANFAYLAYVALRMQGVEHAR